MRPTTHTVQLAGGSLVLPLTMAALRALATIPANPLRPQDGCVDPGKCVRGEQDLSIVTMVDCLHALAGNASPGPDGIFAMGTQADLVKGLAAYCYQLVLAMGPERTPKEEPAPKA